MRHFASLAAIAMTVALPVSAYPKQGDGWRFLDNYLEWSKEKYGKNPADPAGAKGNRSKGMFWDPISSKDFPKTFVLADPRKCRVILYYPTMASRGADSHNDHMNGNETWAVPFAIAPVCGSSITDQETSDWPDYDSEGPGEHAVVFHQLYPGQGYNDDLYIILETKKDTDRSKSDITLDDLVSSDEELSSTMWPMDDKASEAMRNAFKTEWKDSKWVAQEEMTQIAKGYIIARHGGRIPNPFKYGKGSSVWPEYTGINGFYGYRDNGTWITEPPAFD